MAARHIPRGQADPHPQRQRRPTVPALRRRIPARTMSHPSGSAPEPVSGACPTSSGKEETPMTADTITRAFPFSMFDPVHLGIDENGEHVYVNLAERNMLLGGEPGGGKSSAINLIVAHGALSCDCKLILIDGKQVELGLWRHSADMFIGPSIKDALDAFTEFQAIMNARYDKLLAQGRRKISRNDGEDIYLIPIDEYAYYTTVVGDKAQREKFAALTRDLVARGRAAGVIVVLATQRPSHQ